MDYLKSFAGTVLLLEEVDKKLMVMLRDGRTLIGYLRSVDQFANVVLHRSFERVRVGNEYGDIPRGVFIIRGENVVLCGEIDREKETKLPLKEVSAAEILEAQRRELEQNEEKQRLKLKAMKKRGMAANADNINEDLSALCHTNFVLK